MFWASGYYKAGINDRKDCTGCSFGAIEDAVGGCAILCVVKMLAIWLKALQIENMDAQNLWQMRLNPISMPWQGSRASDPCKNGQEGSSSKTFQGRYAKTSDAVRR